MRRFRSGNRRLCVCVCVCEREREREREEGGSQTGSQRVREREVRRRRVYTLWLEARGRIPPRRPLGGRRSLYRSYSLSISLSLCLSVSGPVSLSVSPCRRRTLLIRQIYTIWLEARGCCLSLCLVCQPFSTFNYLIGEFIKRS